MIREFCPNGIKTVPLWKYTAWDKKFNAVDNSMQKSIIKYKYLLANKLNEIVDNTGDIRILYTSEEVAYTTEEKAGEFISQGEIVAIPWGGNPNVKYYNGRFVTGDNRIATSIAPKILDTKFLYYVLLNKLDIINTFYRGAGIKHPSMFSVLTLEIPLPPLNIQKEIVSILDSFTSLIDKMKQEVEMRKKQMEYYREKLMAPQTNWKIKTLGEIGTFTRGNGLQKSDFRVKGFPCVHYGQIHTYYNTCIYKTKSFCEEDLAKKLQKASYGDLLIATTSEDVKACCKAAVWFGAGDVAYSGDSFCYSHDQDPKYMAYLFQTEMFAKQKQKAATGAKVIRVSGESMASFSFAFPPLVQQRQIASILDTFESYISKLEKMIELRQKQYEYYREKLLTFE